MVYFRKPIAAQILSGVVVFVLMFVGAENAFAADDFLRVIVSKKKFKDANKRIDKFLKNYGDIKIIRDKNKAPRGRDSEPPFREIRVKSGKGKALRNTLRKSPLVANIQKLSEIGDRLPGASEKLSKPTDPCTKISTPFFLLESRDKTYFDGLGNFLKNTYQDKCGDCVQLEEVFPRSQRFSVANLNQEVFKDKDFVETLELTFLWIEGEKKRGFTTIVSGQYAPRKGKKMVPPTEFQEMRCQYRKQLKAYAGELRKKLKDYLKNPK
jgi:hypothetical protein